MNLLNKRTMPSESLGKPWQDLKGRQPECSLSRDLVQWHSMPTFYLLLEEKMSLAHLELVLQGGQHSKKEVLCRWQQWQLYRLSWSSLYLVQLSIFVVIKWVQTHEFHLAWMRSLIGPGNWLNWTFFWFLIPGSQEFLRFLSHKDLMLN